MPTDRPASTRRAFLSVAAAAMLVPSAASAQTRKLRIAGLFAGRIDDGGFMEAGYRGLAAAEAKLGVEIAHVAGIAPQREALLAALQSLAATKPDLVLAHGGQNNEAAKAAAEQFPDVRFVVTQGNVTGANLASYEVLQEHSAWLAGAAAGLLTKTGIVGHMSGIRVVPGLKGRAAFANGLAATAPGARLLTNFSGNQDDAALANRIALAEIDAGADLIFTMLNAGRSGATEACRARKVRQFGNVRDWIPVAPDVFVGSAVADSGLAAFNAIADLAAGRFAAGQIRRIGIEQPEAVRLTLAADVPASVRARIDTLAAAIASGAQAVSTEWQGQEFAPA
jgi:basic membrane protein A